MTTTQNKTDVSGVEEVEKTFVKRTGTFLVFFKTTWWEEVSKKHIGNDIYIETKKSIRNIYLNGKLLKK